MQKSRSKEVFWCFQEKLFNYIIKEMNNDEDFVVIIKDLVDPKASFDAKNKQ